MVKISPRHLKVIGFYFGISDFNKTDAMRRAGFAHPNKNTSVFARPEVRAEVARRQQLIQERYELSHEILVGELMRIVRSSVLDFMTVEDDGSMLVDLNKADADQLRAIGEVTIESYMQGKGEKMREVKRIRVKPHDKLRAIDSLMRHAGLSKEKSVFEGAGDLVDRIVAARRRTDPSLVKEDE